MNRQTGDGPPTVSVLMGVHDEETYLRSSIRSLLEQTFGDFELIVVDDCSTDGTPAILESIDDDRLQILRNEENKGLTVSLNRALARARGRYVARQDADDASHPERLQRQVEFLDRHEQVAMVGTGAHLIDGDGRVIHRRRVLRRVTFDDLLEKNHLIHGSVVARRDVLEELGGYDELYQFSQDLDLWLRLARDHEIRNLTEPLYRFRIHDDSVYFDSMEQSMLYAQLALAAARGHLDESVLATIDERGVETYYDHLDADERLAFHLGLAERLLRYGHPARARTECRHALEVSRTATRAYLLYLLSHFGRWPTSLVQRVTRSLINLRILLRNQLVVRDP